VTTGDVTVLAELSPAPLFAAQFLPFFDQYAASHSIWSPHSDAIVLPAIDDAGQAHISVVPIDGRSPLRIADGVLATWSP
jgi:TolB protein